MKHTGKKSNGTMRHMLLLSVFLVAVVALIMGAASPDSWAGDRHHDDDGDEMPFDVAEIYFELNDTDGDLGIHALVDGETWKKLEIEAPNGRELLTIWARSRLRRQGLTELFFESAEPPFDSDDPDEITLTPEQFFRRFPEGSYEVEGRTLEGEELESIAVVTHLLAAPPEEIEVNGNAAPEDCDEGPVPVVSSPVTISWDAVTESHPEIGRTGEPIEVIKYQVVVEQEDLGLVLSLDLPPSVTEVEIPTGFTDLGEEFKFEILVREESGNQTAVESCFEVQ